MENEIAEPNENAGYFVMDAVGQQVEVCFEPLTAEDSDALNGDDWRGARFGDVWKAYAEHEVALKLLLCDRSDPAILGIVWIGIVELKNGKPDVLRNSLLETSPAHRHESGNRCYRGIGRILIARLIFESQALGAAGRLLARPAQGSIPFYRRLGFVTSVDKKYYRLNTEQAEKLLAECLLLSSE